MKRYTQPWQVAQALSPPVLAQRSHQASQVPSAQPQ
jgi:hypothetical protein